MKEIELPASARLVGHRCVPAALRLPRRDDGMVDLSSYVGQSMPVSPKGVRKLLGCDLPVIDALIAAGALEEDVERRAVLKRYLLIDPDLSFQSIFIEWIAGFPTPRSYADFQRYKDMRRVCRIPASAPHPESVLDAALNFLLPMNAINRHELRGILPCTKESEEEIIRWMKHQLAETRRARFIPGTNPPDLATFRLMLPDAIASAPMTCFDPKFANVFDPPPRNVLERLCGLGPLFEAGSIHMLRRAAIVRNPQVLLNRMRAIEVLDEAFREAGHDSLPRSRQAVGAVLTDFALKETLLPLERDFPRTLAGLAWGTMLRDIEDVIGRASAEQQKQLRRWLPHDHHEPLRFRRLLAMAEKASRRDGKRRRKERSDPVADALGSIHEKLALRAEQTAGLADAGHEATLKLLGDSASDYEDFEFTSAVLQLDGTPLDHLQTVMMRCWRRAALLRLLAEDGDGKAMQRRRPGRPKAGDTRGGPSIRNVPESVRKRLAAIEREALEEDEAAADEDEFYFEYLGTMPADPEGPVVTCEPWFISLLRDGVAVRPAMLSVEMRERRRNLILRSKLPGYLGSPAGLLGFGRRGSLVFRAFAEHGTPRVIVPLVQFDHAMRIGHLLFCAQTESSCRIGEALQMTSVRSGGWEPMPNSNESIWQFLAVPKQWAGSDDPTQMEDPFRGYPVDDATLIRAAALEDLLVRRRHPGEPMPQVRPSASAAWKVGDAQYLASIDGRSIGVDIANLFYRYLGAGIVDFRSHDLRHASARGRRKTGSTIKQVAAALGNSSKLAGWYSKLTKVERSASGSPSRRTAATGRVRPQRRPERRRITS